MSNLKNLQERQPLIGIIYIFNEAIFEYCLKYTSFSGQNFKGKLFFFEKTTIQAYTM